MAKEESIQSMYYAGVTYAGKTLTITKKAVQMLRGHKRVEGVLR